MACTDASQEVQLDIIVYIHMIHLVCCELVYYANEGSAMEHDLCFSMPCCSGAVTAVFSVHQMRLQNTMIMISQIQAVPALFVVPMCLHKVDLWKPPKV